MILVPIIGLTILAGLAIFQLLLIFGAPLGNFAWGGAHKVLPLKLRIASVVSIFLYAVFAVFLASKAGFIPPIVDDYALTISMWIFTGYFTLGIIMNAISRSKKERTLMTAVALVLAVIFLVVTLGVGSAAATKQATFTFDQSQAPGWWSGGNSSAKDSVTDDYIGDPAELPASDISVHQGTQSAPGNCFVMLSYHDKAIDTTAALKEREVKTVSGGENFSLEKKGSSTLSLATNEGTKQYDFHQYDLSAKGNDSVMRGNAFGYIRLSNGYIEVTGVCASADELPQTLEALTAISFRQ